MKNINFLKAEDIRVGEEYLKENTHYECVKNENQILTFKKNYSKKTFTKTYEEFNDYQTNTQKNKTYPYIQADDNSTYETLDEEYKKEHKKQIQDKYKGNEEGLIDRVMMYMYDYENDTTEVDAYKEIIMELIEKNKGR